VTPAVLVEGVSKRYRQIQRTPTLSGALLDVLKRRPANQFYALQDLSFSCEVGETMGVIGRNGAGKTTLLRLLAGVTAPTAGRVSVRGRIAPLIGIGVGFDPELTGRENVLINAQMLGVSPADTRSRFEEIVAFSELEGFVDTAVKYYSSGMFLRLAFAVLVHVEPQVLLADELLAVGDVAFQAKCIERMRELKDEGTTIVLVSHNLDTVQRMCERTLVLSRGVLVFDGGTDEAIAIYHRLLHEEQANLKDEAHQGVRQREENAYVGGATISRFEIVDAEGVPTTHLQPGEPWRVLMDIDFDRPVSDPVIGVSLSQGGRGLLYASYTGPGDYVGEHGPDRPLHADISLGNPMLSGSFVVQAVVRDAAAQLTLGFSLPAHLAVSSNRRDIGIVDLGATYQLAGQPVTISERPHMRSRAESPDEL
jgi:ABC-type polysaccharide/polyol phosphate transport system ATPase subunit